MLDTTTGSNILKVRYLPPIRKQLNNATVLLNRIERADDVMVSGKTFTIPLQTGRNTAAAIARGEGDALPTAGQQGYDVAVVPNAFNYSRIKVSGIMIRAARDASGAFVTAVDSEITGVTRDTARGINRQLHGDGTGAIAYWTGADDTSGTNVDDKRGNAFTYLGNGAATYDLIDASDNATKLGDSIVVTPGAVAATNVAVTWTGTVSGSADEDYLVNEDTLGKEMMGIAGIVSTANPPLLSGGLHGLPVATKTFFVSQVVTGDTSGTNQALTLDRMQKPLDLIGINSPFSEDDVAFLLSNYQVRAKHVSLLLADKRHVNTLKLDGGWKGIEFNGIPHVVDSQCLRNRIYYVVPEVLKIYRTSDFDWMERDGSLLKYVPGYDEYEAIMFHYGNLGCTCRNALGLLIDISE